MDCFCGFAGNGGLYGCDHDMKSAGGREPKHRCGTPEENPPAAPSAQEIEAGRGVNGRPRELERRRFPRHSQRMPLALSVFNRAGVAAAWMVDYGLEGICVETDQRLMAGTSVQLRLAGTNPPDGTLHPETALSPGFRTLALGEVKWCRAVGTLVQQGFRLGIRYYPHY